MDDDVSARVARLENRLRRERDRRAQAEAIAERVTSELYAALGERTDLNSALREFVAIAAHDLRGPLTSILGFTAMMEKGWDRLEDDRRRELVSRIGLAGLRIKRLTDDLMVLSELEAGALEPQPELRSLADPVAAALESFPGHRDDVRLAELDVAVHADMDHVRRIVANYLTNAAKYGAPPIEVLVDQKDEWIELRVCDHGSGVPDEFLPRLFDRFARSDQARSSGEEGTGLGLAIVRGLAATNGGEVWYEPASHGGSCFGLRLRAEPMKTADSQTMNAPTR